MPRPQRPSEVGARGRRGPFTFSSFLLALIVAVLAAQTSRVRPDGVSLFTFLSCSSHFFLRPLPRCSNLAAINQTKSRLNRLAHLTSCPVALVRVVVSFLIHRNHHSSASAALPVFSTRCFGHWYRPLKRCQQERKLRQWKSTTQPCEHASSFRRVKFPQTSASFFRSDHFLS